MPTKHAFKILLGKIRLTINFIRSTYGGLSSSETAYPFQHGIGIVEQFPWQHLVFVQVHWGGMQPQLIKQLFLHRI